MEIHDEKYIMGHLWFETKWSSGALVIFLVWSGLVCSGLLWFGSGLVLWQDRPEPSGFPDVVRISRTYRITQPVLLFVCLFVCYSNFRRLKDSFDFSISRSVSPTFEVLRSDQHLLFTTMPRAPRFSVNSAYLYA
jgi:hypothetical protein